MNYVFSNLNFAIFGLDGIDLNEEFQSFRTEDISNPNCNIKIIYTDTIKDIQRKPVFYGERSFLIYNTLKGESRIFLEYYSGNRIAMLEDYGDQKTLWLLNKKQWSEKRLLNCLALEKTMNELGRIILHASFIETEKGAVLFTAPSGTGKSTQAELWNKYRGTEIINGDRASIWKYKNKWWAGGIPWSGTSGITKNKKMPLKAIVILKQGSENKVNILPVITKLKYLLEQTTINPWNQQMLLRSQEILTQVCMEVPILQLSCRPDRESVEVLAKELGR